jgi:16S rRNA pseudouridine516 synthase
MAKIKTELPLVRILQSQGFGTRKDCAHLVWQGLVKVQNEVQTDPNRVFNLEKFEFQVGSKSWMYASQVYIKAWKSSDLECTHQSTHHDSVFSLFPSPLVERGLLAAGRLDVDTEGLILFSDDGQFVHHVTSPKKELPKTYHIQLKHPGSDELCTELLAGVQLRDEKTPTQAKSAKLIDPLNLELEITEGKYHQVKRMIAAAGNRVEALKRTAIGGVTLEGLEMRGWSHLTALELEALGWKGSQS